MLLLDFSLLDYSGNKYIVLSSYLLTSKVSVKIRVSVNLKPEKSLQLVLRPWLSSFLWKKETDIFYVEGGTSIWTVWQLSICSFTLFSEFQDNVVQEEMKKEEAGRRLNL